jgi:hypothetical protein
VRESRLGADPHQDFTALINGQSLGLDDFRLQILDIVVVEIEAPLESAV